MRRSHPSHPPRGCSHVLGRPSGTVIVCTDADRADELARERRIAVAVCAAGGLVAAAKGVRGRYPCLSVLVAARNAAEVEEARAAAEAVGGTVVAAERSGEAHWGTSEPDQ